MDDYKLEEFVERKMRVEKEMQRQVRLFLNDFPEVKNFKIKGKATSHIGSPKKVKDFNITFEVKF